MRFDSFEIFNFRGIERARIDLSPAGAGIFTLIGLNESGKTTILEAIQTFQMADDETRHLYASDPGAVNPHSFIPKHEAAGFTGETKVVANASFSPGEKRRLLDKLRAASGIEVDPETVPDTLRFTRGYQFKDSDVVGPIRLMSSKPKYRTGAQRKFREFVYETPDWYSYARVMTAALPDIVYFPTFLFNQPERIALTPAPDEKAVDKVYRQVIENVATSLDRPKSVQTHIVERLTKPESYIESVAGFYQLVRTKEEQVDAVVSDMSAHLTETIFDQWSKIFDANFKDREILLKWSSERQPDGTYKVYVTINIKDGRQQYEISERSLGFRWFFSFLLFTVYRSAGNDHKPVLFLLDEPASNLHSKAQMQLLASFPRIARNGSALIYSTHSHYMINPAWLDQAFIVSNKGVQYEDFRGEKSGGGKRRHTHIDIEKYRSFVGQNPDKPTYFQPVLDKLEVVPSQLDALKPAVVVEGKGDYLILRYGLTVLLEEDPDYAILPTRGADGVSELAGLLLAWDTNFALVFDDDSAGRRARDEFRSEWGIADPRSKTLGDILPDLKGKRIEGLLDDTDLALIAEHYDTKAKLTKSQIQLFFSEKLAKEEAVPMSPAFKARIAAFHAHAVATLEV